MGSSTSCRKRLFPSTGWALCVRDLLPACPAWCPGEASGVGCVPSEAQVSVVPWVPAQGSVGAELRLRPGPPALAVARLVLH